MFICNFRTLANGSYNWIKRGQRRGYWRLLEVIDSAGSLNCNSHNVIRIVAQGQPGIDGVTKRSAYWIDPDRDRFNARAARLNAEALARGLIRAYAPDVGLSYRVETEN